MKVIKPIIACLAALSIGLTTPNAGAGAQLDQFVIAVGGDFVSLDPAVSSSASDQEIMALTYSRLTWIDAKSGKALPSLARAWKMSANGKEWTFWLRDEKFQDGSPVTADAVAYSFERIRKVGRATAESLSWLKNVHVVDRRTVRFELGVSFPVLNQLLAVPGFAIVNPAVVHAHEVNNDNGSVWLSEHSAGSGAYRVASWERGQRLILERASGFTGPPVVIFRVIPDAASRRVQLQKGDVDFVGGIGAREAPEWAKISGVTLDVSHVPNTLYYLSLNTTRAPLKDARVRRAIGLAIDYEGLRRDVLGGNAVLINGPIPPGFPGHDRALGVPHRDLAAARKLLAEAGLVAGFNLRYVVGQPGPVSQYVQANLKDAGINAQFQQLASTAFDAARTSGDFDMIYDGFILDYPDPSIIMNLIFPTGAAVNFSRYSNPVVDRLLKEAFAETNPSKRIALYARAQSLIVHDQPIVPLFAPDTIVARRNAVVGFHLNPYQSYVYDLSHVTVR
jgi:peptide/nickel transport system substrate-binding protein